MYMYTYTCGYAKVLQHIYSGMHLDLDCFRSRRRLTHAVTKPKHRPWFA